MIILEVSGNPVAIHADGDWDEPSATAVVMIHGAGMDHTAWRYLTRYMAARGFSALAVDLPGHGQSGGIPLDTIQEMASWLSALLAKLPQQQFVLMGQSMGSLIAMECASREPESVVGLILLGTTTKMEVHPELLDAAAAGDHHAVDLMSGWMHTGHHRMGGHPNAGLWVSGSVAKTLERHLDGALGTDLAACNRYEPLTVASLVEQPVLIVQGVEDKMTPMKAAQALCRDLPDGKIVGLESAGHMAVLENPRDVASQVGGFVTTIGRS